jgi:hypothetical protein
MTRSEWNCFVCQLKIACSAVECEYLWTVTFGISTFRDRFWRIGMKPRSWQSAAPPTLLLLCRSLSAQSGCLLCNEIDCCLCFVGWDPFPATKCINHNSTGTDVCKLSLTCSNTANSLLIGFAQFESFPRTYELLMIKLQKSKHYTMNVYFHKIQTPFKHNDWLKGSLIPYSRGATNLTCWQTQLDWAEWAAQ